MKPKYYILITVVLLTIFGFSFSNFTSDDKPIIINDGKSYTELWSDVEKFEEKGLPKSALKIVNVIYADAKKHNNSNQIIKSFIYKMKFNNVVEESAFETSIYDLQKEIKQAKYPAINIMHSMLAEMYWMYYQSNRYKFSNRTQTVGFKNNDIKTWDLNTLSDKVIKEYRLSLNNKDSLKRTSITHFDAIVIKGIGTVNLRSTLYDFLAQRTISFFKNKEITLSRPADKFQLKEDFYFANASVFADKQIESNDTLSLQFYGIQVLQDLLKFRLKDKNINAYIDVDIQRLNYVYANSVNLNKDVLYEKALLYLFDKYGDNSFSTNISYNLGLYYKKLGQKYYSTDTLTYKYKKYNKLAYNTFKIAAKKYPKNTGALKCVYEYKQFENIKLSFSTEQVVPSNKKFATLIMYKNIDVIYTKISKIDRKSYNKIKQKYYGEDKYNRLLKDAKAVSTNKIALLKDDDLNEHQTELLLSELELGFYLISISNDSEFSYNKSMVSFKPITVSNLSYISSEITKGIEFYVLDRNTGSPVANVNADYFINKYNYKERKYITRKIGTKTTDNNGFFNIISHANSNESYFIEFSKGKDFISSNNSFYINNYYRKEKPQIVNSIFTDRAIYRPGQTVYFKGISIKHDGDKRVIISNSIENIVFYDVNYQRISSLKLTTNEFGTFNGSFQIPTGILNGQMHIKTSHGSKYIRVEEYKRPKFETEFLPFNKNYKLNQEVEVEGKATSYAGSSISEAMVKYRIVRTPIWRYWWWNRGSAVTEIDNGSVTTNEKGIYTIKFKAIPDLQYKKSDKVSFSYTIYANVTDLNGETQSTQKTITIGYVDLNLYANIPTSLQKESTDTFKISTTNLNGEMINAKGTLKIYKLKSPKKALRKRLWQQPDKFIYSKEQWSKQYKGNVFKQNNLMQYVTEEQVYTMNFDTKDNDILLIPNLIQWKTGHYKIVIKSADAFENKIDKEQFFTVFSEKSKKMPYAEISWFKPLKVNCQPGETATILIGSSKNVNVLYEVQLKDKTIKKEFIKINNEQKTISIPIFEEYRGNISVSFNYIYDNRMYSYTQHIVVPYKNKELDIEFQTFRNKLYPGEKEKWLMTIKDKKGDAVMAEMLATLYDKSLDNFATNYWDLNVWSNNYSRKYWQGGMFSTSNSQLLYNNNNTYYTYPNLSYDSFNWFGFSYYRNYYGSNRRNKGSRAVYPVEKSAEGMAMNGLSDETAAGEMDRDAEKKPASLTNGNQPTSTLDGSISQEQQNVIGDNIDSRKGKDLSKVKARTNFSETAFFYPELRTNKKGELVVEFTIPESLTTWKMMGLATTKDLKIGRIKEELITQKDLMVMPNPPRFFREGDRISFPLKISNISKNNLNVDCNIEFLNAITNKPLSLIKDFEKETMKIPAGGNKMVSAVFIVPENVDAIKYRVVAKAGKFSDAEENVIPVLNNRMLVTESLPLPIRGNQTKTFTFDKLKNNKSKTLRNHKYTLEFTSNPAWYAVQSLPYLMEYPYECAEQTFSRFYANSLASHIANSSPKIQAVFNSWKNTKNSKALLSSLEKNQELKALILEETPWVLDGKDESERKARIGLLFDLNKMSNELSKAIKKLQNMQASNGGWPWFKGMPDNRYITQYIVSGLGHLDHLKINYVRKNNKTWRMITNAINYLDNRIREDYRDLKKYYSAKKMKDDHVGSMQIQYLYARSFFTDVKINRHNQEAYEYYFNQAKEYWLNKDKYSQGMIALALHREVALKSGSKVEQDIVKSLKENSITHKEMGMYWKDNTAGYYWYQAPIETQALMIEVFDEVTNDQESVENLKIWLLKQKQTQNWKTTKATSEAVYALLLKGNNLLASNNLVEIKLGNKIIDPSKIDGVDSEAGTGYFKTSWSGNEITPEMGEIIVTKKDDGVAWGAVYWQYFEQLDKITKHKTPLYLDKKLFIEKITNSGKTIEPIAKNKIKIGDKIIVRIELRVDRNMEYVHMKDMRASGFEPINVISRYKYQDGLGYYETTKDASTNFFMDNLRKGTYVFEYSVRVSHKGDFSNGITTIQCMYAPEFTSHSEGVRIVVE